MALHFLFQKSTCEQINMEKLLEKVAIKSEFPKCSGFAGQVLTYLAINFPTLNNHVAVPRKINGTAYSTHLLKN